MVSMAFRTSGCAWFGSLRCWHQLPLEHCVDSKPDVLTLSIDANTLLIYAPATSRTHFLPLHPLCDDLREATRAGKEICSWMNSGSLRRSKAHCQMQNWEERKSLRELRKIQGLSPGDHHKQPFEMRLSRSPDSHPAFRPASTT